MVKKNPAEEFRRDMELIKQQNMSRPEEITFQEDIFEQITKETEPAVERMIRETVQQLFNRANIYMISDLTRDNLNEFYKLVLMDSLFFKDYAWRMEKDNPTLYNTYTTLYNKLLELSISLNRKGREEFIKILGKLREEEKEQVMMDRGRG